MPSNYSILVLFARHADFHGRGGWFIITHNSSQGRKLYSGEQQTIGFYSIAMPFFFYRVPSYAFDCLLERPKNSLTPLN